MDEDARNKKYDMSTIWGKSPERVALGEEGKAIFHVDGPKTEKAREPTVWCEEFGG